MPRECRVPYFAGAGMEGTGYSLIAVDGTPSAAGEAGRWPLVEGRALPQIGMGRRVSAVRATESKVVFAVELRGRWHGMVGAAPTEAEMKLSWQSQL